MGDDASAQAQLSAARTEYATRLCRRFGHASPSSLPSWLLELIRDCLLTGYRIADDAPAIPPRAPSPGAYSYAEPSEDEVTRVGRPRRERG